MAKLSHADSKRMYSWWWDSHISPKNSKWLQQNLTDMDVKVKSMIKLIEVDEDSFARRAEMYYKKRPELMKMVEEFYRAYRALAERYDHATGVIRHAHRTMSEAQFPMLFADESPASSVSGTDARTPDSSNLMGDLTDESDHVTRRKPPKPFNDSFGPVEQVRRGLSFDEAEDKEESAFSNGDNHVNDLRSLKLDQESDSKEIKELKEAIAKLEAEKEAGFAKYQQTLDKLSQLETEISKTREDFRMLRDHASKYDTEVAALKDALEKSEAEKESKLQDYQNCLDIISELQTTVSTTQDDAQKLNVRATSAENEVQSLRSELDKLAVEKDAALNQYMQSLETISNLENKLQLAEEDSSRFKERAEKAESEVESLRHAISKLTEEKETVSLQYKQCLETISDLEQKLKLANEEAKRLNGEIESGVSKLLGAKEQYLMLEKSNQSLHSELEFLTSKMGAQSQELIEKQKELGKLWACVQEERLRFVDAETAFQTLQHLHAQTQEELQAVASELQNRAQLLKVAETQKQSLQDEVLRINEENKHLDGLNSSSALLIKDMQNEICSLTELKEKLEKEVELQIDQRNALQQEIYCLKEEINDLNKHHLSVLDQVHAVGLNPESLRSSVKELQDENSKLREKCQSEIINKAALLQKLEILEQLIEKNLLLENSLSDLNAELDAVRGKIEELKLSHQSLMEEKSMLLDEKEKCMTQLQETSKNLEELLGNNTVLENSLSDAQHQLEALKAKSKILEDSCQVLVNEKADLTCEKDALTSQLQRTQRELVDLENLQGKLEGRCEHLENEKESTLRKVEELEISLGVEKQEHASHIEMSGARLTEVQSEVHELQEECQRKKIELDHVLDTAIGSEIEIFILRTTAQVLKENNYSLVTKNQILSEKSSLSKAEILCLEQSNIEQQSEIRSLSDHLSSLRSGTHQLLKVLSIAEDCACADSMELDQVYVNQLLTKLHHLKKSLWEAEEENIERSVSLSVLVTWIKELALCSKNLEVEKDKIEHEFKIKTDQVLQLRSDSSTFLQMNEELMSKLREGDRDKEALIIQIEKLNAKLTDMQDTCQDLRREKVLNSKEKTSLKDTIFALEEKHSVLEEENHDLYDTVLALQNLSLIFRSVTDEKLGMLRELGDDWNRLNEINIALMQKLSMAEGRFEESKHENLHLSEEKRSLKDRIMHLEKKHNVLEVENYDLCSKVLALENLSLIFRSFSDEKFRVLKELGDDWNILNEMNSVLKGKLSLAEGSFEESKLENTHLKERLQKTEDELEVVSAVKDQLSIEIENGKEILQQMAQDLREAEDKISLVEKKELELNRSVEGLRMEYNVVKMAQDDQENQILNLSTHNDHLSKENKSLREACQKLEFDLQVLEDNNSKRKLQEESLRLDLENKLHEINELETGAASLFGELQYTMISHALYEQKFNELNDACLGYIDRNGSLETQLAAFGPEILSLKECISSLEDQTDAHIKFQIPEDSELQGSGGGDNLPESSLNEDKKVSAPVSNMRDIRVRLQAIVKAAVEIKEQMVQENIDLHSKLNESTRQIELLQSESGRHRRNRRPTSEITEDNALLTKDIVLDQISDGSYRDSKNEAADVNNPIESWETSDPDATVGLSVGKSNGIASPSTTKTAEIHLSKSGRKQKGGFGASDALNEENLSVDKLEISKTCTDSFQEGNKRKVLERLDSDVQKLTNLQITVQDLKRKQEVIEKDTRGKAVIECESLKRQLEEADMAVMKLFDLNGRLTKSLDDMSFPDTKSSFDFEGEDGAKRKRVSEEARRMSEKIGRLQLEVQKLQFILLKLEDEKGGRSMKSETKRRIILRDYLYGGGRTGQRRKKSNFCACFQPSTVED